MSYGENYSVARAEIEDLMARYIFALDWRDLETYLETFTEDGVLVGGVHRLEGRDAIRAWWPEWCTYFVDNFGEGYERSLPRHFITSLALKVDGDRATGRAYWFNNVPPTNGVFGRYGHYEDEFRRVDGRWLLAKREVVGQFIGDLPPKPENPAW